MCGATRPRRANIEGCLSLLQSWARFRFPFLRPRVNHPYTFPLIMSYHGLPSSLEDIRLLLDQRSKVEDPWQAVFTDVRGEAAANTCQKGKTRASNPRGQDDEGSPSTTPRQSPGSSSAAMQSPSRTRAPTQSLDAAIQPMIPTQPPFQMMPVLWQVGAKCPVQLHFLLCRVDRRYIGQRCTRDRKGGRGSSS
ncbi:hypothetical protein Gotur_026792 [Gossypium turneri]